MALTFTTYFKARNENFEALNTWKQVVFPFGGPAKNVHFTSQYQKLKNPIHYNYINLLDVKGFLPLSCRYLPWPHGLHGQKHKLKFEPWAATLAAISKLSEPAKVIFNRIAQPDVTDSYHIQIRNGDVDMAPPSEVNMQLSLLIAALNILKFAKTSDEDNAPPRFVQRLDKARAGYYYGYHADDWFRVVFAIIYFLERRRKTIDTASGLFKGSNKELKIFKVSKTDSLRMVSDSLEHLAEEDELRTKSIVLQNMRNQIPSLPPGLDDNALDRLLRRFDGKYTYMVNLDLGTSLTRIRKESILAKKQQAATLNERYREILALTLPAAKEVVQSLRRRLVKAKYFNNTGESSSTFYDSLGEGAKSYLENSENLVPAFATLEEGEKDETVQYIEIMKLLKLAAITGEMIDTLQPSSMDWEGTMKLLGADMAKMSATDGFSWKRIPIPGAHPDFRFKAHQVVSAANLFTKLSGFVRGAILANDAGTGKTLTVMLLAMMLYRRCLNLKAAGRPFQAGPVFWVTQTVLEIDKAFPGTFKIHCYYGTITSDNPVIANATITPERLEELGRFWAKNSDDPELCLEIVVMSYTTLMSRNTDRTNVEVPVNSIAHIRPELMDFQTYDPGFRHKIQGVESVPAHLHFAGSRGGAGRNAGKGHKEALGRKRRKKAKEEGQQESEFSDNDPDAEDDDMDESELDEEVDAAPDLASRYHRQPKAMRDFLETSNVGAIPDLEHHIFDVLHNPYADEAAADMISKELELDVAACDTLGKSATVAEAFKFRQYLSDAKFKASLMVLDEAHNVKDPKNGTSRATMLLPASAVVMVTATPTLNSIEDYFGIALQVWRRSKFYDFTLPAEVSWTYMVEYFEILPIELKEVTNSAQCDVGYIWRDDFTDSAIVRENNKHITRHLFWYLDQAGPPRQALLDWSLKTKCPWYLLHPSSVRNIKGSRNLGDLGGEMVYRALQQLLTVRNPLNMKIDLPDGTHTYPREEMPPMDVTYVQCQYPKETAEVVNTYVTGLLKLLPNMNSDDKDKGKTGRVTRSSASAVLSSDAEAVKRINMTCHRLLTLKAIDYRSFLILSAVEDKTSSTAGLIKLQKALQEGKFKDIMPEGSKEQLLHLKALIQNAGGENKARGQDTPGPKLGSAHTDSLADQHPSGGLAWLYSISPDTINTVPPTGRFEMVYWALSESPVLLEVFDLVLQFRSEGLRSLIVVNNPWLQNYIHSVLAFASIGVGSIRASHTSNERDSIVHAFNSEEGDIEFLVINQSLSMAGLNLHHKCCRGIVAQYSWNYWGLFQVISRLYRIGQRWVVKWFIVVCAGTYSHVLEDKMCRKIVPEIIFTGRIPEWIKGATLRKMVAYEILRMKFSHPFNRFVWVINPPTSAADYTNAKMTRMGTLCSMIVNAIIKMDPEHEDTPTYLEQLESSVCQIMHAWGCDRRSRTRFDIGELNRYMDETRDFRPDCPQAPFWARAKDRSSVYKTTPDDTKDGMPDPQCTCILDRASCIIHDFGMEFSVDPDHTSGMEDPDNVAELVAAISEFMDVHGLAPANTFVMEDAAYDKLAKDHDDYISDAEWPGEQDNEIEAKASEITRSAKKKREEEAEASTGQGYDETDHDLAGPSTPRAASGTPARMVSPDESKDDVIPSGGAATPPFVEYKKRTARSKSPSVGQANKRQRKDLTGAGARAPAVPGTQTTIPGSDESNGLGQVESEDVYRA
ncbi:hypothetical protein C8A00DRAFT_35617 [Chaetomidium leptoderma]|uniref:Helicase ATP-binding domain-containing protein n=1 Tax=Chaetomidium leptoderma TaxID=669021 RepID=A0AAN6ZUT5_9PEZI|nr:hypothetical protein C8A00DRAFT_35617 [Chaetomidium leptoderma]